MCKKRKIITITVLFVLGVAVSYLQWGREIDVVGSMGTSSENFHEEHVTFTLNRLIITDKEKCAEEIIKKCRENDFASTLFSYDVAKPKFVTGFNTKSTEERAQYDSKKVSKQAGIFMILIDVGLIALVSYIQFRAVPAIQNNTISNYGTEITIVSLGICAYTILVAMIAVIRGFKYSKK